MKFFAKFMTRKINLPDVDLNSPDIYESEGVLGKVAIYDHSEDESAEELPNEDIVTDRIQIQREVFVSKKENIIKGESYQERYDRLVYEAQQLLQDLEQSDEPVQLKEQVHDLLTNLNGMNSRVARSNLEHIPKDTHAFTELKNQIVSFQSNTLKSSQEKKESDRLVYHLSYHPELSKEEIKNVELENRITNLERFLGVDTLDPLQSISNPENAKSILLTSSTLMGALEKLDRQLSILSQPHVFEQTIRRVQESQAQLERLVEVRKKLKIELGLHRGDAIPAGELATFDDKLNTLYNQMMKLDPVSNMIPHIIARLKALQSVHNEAAQFSSTLQALGEDQEHLRHVAQSTKQGLDSLLATIVENQTQIAKNIETLDQRMSELMKQYKK
jgi:hypothetical protein